MHYVWMMKRENYLSSELFLNQSCLEVAPVKNKFVFSETESSVFTDTDVHIWILGQATVVASVEFPIDTEMHRNTEPENI